MTTTPQRLVLSRRKGFNLQASSLALNGLPAQRVSRPGPWGNPFTIEEFVAKGLDRAAAQAEAVRHYGLWVAGQITRTAEPLVPPPATKIRAALRGKNLACWCAPGTPCHADTLLRIANS